MKQHTIKGEISFSGKGLHTGLNITAILCPAPIDFGVQFCRTDLPDTPYLPAKARFVSDTSRGTVLENEHWKVSTVEHALAALYGMGVSNCLIKVNGPEMPILGGSAIEYVNRIKEIGIVEQNAEQKLWVIEEPIHYELPTSGTIIDIYPAQEHSIEVTIDFNSPILTRQTAKLEYFNSFAEEIASARTFCFVREIEPLLQLGYIKGGDLQNAIVIYDKPLSQDAFNAMATQLKAPQQDASQLGYLCKLHYENEPARHKLLDLIGDLSLIGCRIQGRIVAYKPGHTANTAFAKEVLKKELI